MQKITASKRTVGLFDGKTDEEKAIEAERIKQDADIAGSEERGPAETIEEASDRYRRNAFVGQEWTTRHFGDPCDGTEEYRLSIDNGWMYLERTERSERTERQADSGGAFSYRGLFLGKLPSLGRLLKVLVEAYKANGGKVEVKLP